MKTHQKVDRSLCTCGGTVCLAAHARPYKVRDDAYRSEFPAEKAETKMTALMMEGSALIFALLMAMTKGEDAAVDAPIA